MLYPGPISNARFFWNTEPGARVSLAAANGAESCATFLLDILHTEFLTLFEASV
jgi:hypothetical protein